MKVFDTFRKCCMKSETGNKNKTIQSGVTRLNLHKTATLVHYTFKSSTEWTTALLKGKE